jgi:Subtilisin inhibitor-like
MALLVLLLAGLTAATSSSAAGSATSLRISFWEDGGGAPDAVWTLRCNPPGGSLPRPARACTKLAAGAVRHFAGTPRNVACTEIYGGPQEARITGSVAGKRIWTTVTRTNGCEIERWQRLTPWLLPPGGVT